GLCRLRQQAQVSGVMVRDERYRPEDGKWDMARDKVIDRLAGAPIGDVFKFDPRNLRKPFSDKMLLCTGTRCRVPDTWPLLGRANQLGNRVYSKRWVSSEHDREMHQFDDWSEVFYIIDVEGHNIRRACHHIGRR